MIKIDLHNFALTGEFGPVTLGMSKAKVIQYLGEPSGDNDFQSGSSVLQYGNYELFYWTDTKKLYAIQNDRIFTKTLQLNTFNDFKFKVTPWIFEKKQSLSHILKMLDEYSMGYELSDYVDRMCINLKSGFKIDFETEDGIPLGSNEKSNEKIMNAKLQGFRFFKI